MSFGSLCGLLFVMPIALWWPVVRFPVVGVLPEFSSAGFLLSDVLLLVAVLCWMAGHLLDPRLRLRMGPRFVAAPLAVLVLVSAVSVRWAPSRVVAADVALRLLLLFVLYLLVVESGARFRCLAWFLVAGMVVQAILATLQFAHQASLGLAWLGEPDARITVPGLWVRGTGLTRHPNILGGYLLLGLFSLLALSWSRSRPRVGLMSLQLLGVSGLICTFSRSAWLGLVLGLTVAAAALVLSRGSARRSGAIALGAFAVTILMAATVYGWVGADLFVSRLVVPLANTLGVSWVPADHVELTDLRQRAGYGSVARELISAHPVLGVGAGNFAIASRRLEPDLPAAHAYLPVHNVPLLVAAELGLMGAAAWLFMAGGVLIAIARQARRMARCRWFLAWSLAVIALLAIGVWDSYIWSWQSGRLIFFVTLGLWSASYAQVDTDP